MAAVMQRHTETTSAPPPRAGRSTKATRPRADATPVAAARVRCAYPIVLALRGDRAAGEALWVGGPPSKPIVHYRDNVYSTFDAAAEGMIAPPTSAPRRRRTATRSAATTVSARTLMEARARLCRPGQDDDDDGNIIDVTVTLSELLDAVTRYGRTTTHICVARSASWVSEALARRSLPIPAVTPRRRPRREPSDMERMMRRLDRIVSEVASEMRLTDLDSASSDNDLDIVVVHSPEATARPPASRSLSLARTAPSSALTADSIATTTTATTLAVALGPSSEVAAPSATLATSSTLAPPVPSTQPAPIQTDAPTHTQEPVLRPARRTSRKRQAPTPPAPSQGTENDRPSKRTRRPTAGSTPPAPQSLTSRRPTVTTTTTTTSSNVMAETVPIGIDSDRRTTSRNGVAVDRAASALCTIALVPCNRAPGVECSICMRDDGNVLWDTAMDRPATLRDLWVDPGRSALVPDGTRLEDDTIVVNPCRETDHAVCVGCMRAVLLNPGRPPVGLERAAVGCVSLDGESRCAATSYDEARVFGAVLEPSEAAHLTALYERHRFPGMEVVTCPLHILVDRTAQQARRRGPRVDVLPCGAECMIEHASVSRADRGHLVITCTQNSRCGGSFCYHCRSRLPAGATRCGRCVRVSERDNPDGVNRYFCRPALVASASKDDVAGSGGQPAWLASGGGADAHLLRNREVTEEVAVDQIERVMSMDRVAQPCYRCGVPLLKSTECNGLSHCGVQKCYMCGRNALAGGHLESDHWDADGATGCPRYDHHAYWRRMKTAPFVCSEGRCYNDAAECTVPAHRAGIEAMHAERRVWHVWGMLRSLSHDLGERVMARLTAATRPGDDARSLLLARVAKTLAQEAALARSTGADGTRT
ncbi:hypothetical protein pneo_cds_212 [Pandoravirus neocaledonia]|uniref:Uncharacterized protein n=1 Tax=Pandoravirus neocaledonia TaxID=2107708 RepID=A0A2U7UBI3_9VIRU|nr:hypothetical protein pneo_cds_212 [Pandoravirus neocaledonia]AVK75819.1 hypothetical protein pneo_cds_212 [Pandoravirus neocaledonia]